MHFVYEGFTQAGSRRRFLFRRVEERTPVEVFAIDIDLPLLAQNRVSIQDGPSFCLQLLTKASSEGPVDLHRLHSYLVVGEDFRPLIVERQRRETEKALKIRARAPYHKPPLRSNLRIGEVHK
jgi:hypothetical protein